MSGYGRALRECLGNPISVITNGKLWMIFLLVEFITIATILIRFKRYGKVLGITNPILMIIVAVLTGYIIHFLIVTVITGTIYSGHIIP